MTRGTLAIVITPPNAEDIKSDNVIEN
jgi:hypothetical protein